MEYFKNANKYKIGNLLFLFLKKLKDAADES